MSKNLLKHPGSSLQNWRNRYFYYSTKHKKLFKYPGFEKINNFIILPSIKKLLEYTGFSLRNWKKILKKLLKYPGSFLQNWKKWLYYSTKQKKPSLNILGLPCRIEKKNMLKITWRNLLEYSGSSEQNQDPGSLKTKVRGGFNIYI